MKIAVLSALYPYRGGIAEFGDYLIRALSPANEVRGFTFTRQYPEILFPGKTQYADKRSVNEDPKNLRLVDSVNPISWMRASDAIDAFSPDVLITAYWMSFFAPSLGYTSGKVNCRTKKIALLHNIIPHEPGPLDRPLTKYFLNKFDGFVSLSESVRHDLLDFKGKDARHIILNHPLYDHYGKRIDSGEARAKLGIDQDRKTILFFGFIRKYKGLDLLIEAFGKLDSSYQLIIAGECYGSFDEYRAMIDKSPLRNNIRVFGDYISDSDVPLYFSAADVCVLPYRSATQSGITSVALHFELPVIATDTGGLKEVIEEGSAGIITDAISPEAIAAAIRNYFQGKMKEQFEENIRKFKIELSWENFAEKLEGFMNDLCKREAPAA